MLKRLFPIAVLALTGPGQAQDEDRFAQARQFLPDAVREQVHQLYVEPHWIGETGHFWYRRETAEGDLYLYVDPEESPRPLFDHRALAAALTELSGEPVSPLALELGGLTVDEDEAWLEFDFSGDRYRYALANSAIEAAPDAEDDVPGLSPDGRWRVFRQDHNLHVENMQSGDVRALTADGTEDQPYGIGLINPRRMLEQDSQTPDLPAVIDWSEDNERIATYRLDRRGVTRLSMTRQAEGDEGEDFTVSYDYPRSMDAVLPTAQPLVINVTDGEQVVLDTAPLPVRYYGGPWIFWSSRDEVAFEFLDRNYKFHGMMEFDAATGEGRVVVRDDHAQFVNYYDQQTWPVADWDSVLWVSDIDGWKHIYDVDMSASEPNVRQLTDGEWRVSFLLDVVEDENLIFFSGSGRETDRDPYYRTVYRLDRDSGDVRLLTPEPVDHGVYFSPDGRYFVDNMSTANQPTRAVLRSSENGSILVELGQADASVLDELGFVAPQPFTVTLENGLDLYGVIYYPAGFDPEGSYPVIEEVYTGPHTYNAQKSYTRVMTRTPALSTAQIGAIVIQLDAPGTAGRSRDFLAPAWQNLGEVGLDERIEALRTLAEDHPYMDLDRVGVFGMSAGGYDTVRFLLRRPDFYDAGVALSGNYDSRWDKAIWNEQWLGSEDMSVYEANSNLTIAGNLRGDLLLAHGMLDENVPVRATEELAAAFDRAGRPYELHYIPNAHHWLDGDPEFHEIRWEFFSRVLVAQDRASGDAGPAASD